MHFVFIKSFLLIILFNNIITNKINQTVYNVIQFIKYFQHLKEIFPFLYVLTLHMDLRFFILEIFDFCYLHRFLQVYLGCVTRSESKKKSIRTEKKIVNWQPNMKPTKAFSDSIKIDTQVFAIREKQSKILVCAVCNFIFIFYLEKWTCNDSFIFKWLDFKFEIKFLTFIWKR